MDSRNKEHRRAKKAIFDWHERHHRRGAACRVTNVHPRAYVIGYAAPGCIIVAIPWMDSSRLLREFTRDNPLKQVHLFDDRIEAGDWVYYGYVRTDQYGQLCAVKITEG